MPRVVLPNLTPSSTLAELPGSEYSVEAAVPGQAVAAEFERRPDLPGVIILAQGHFAGMIAREAFFQQMSRRYSREIYLCRPIGLTLDRGNSCALRLPANRLISDAARLALERSPENAYDPIVVDPGDEGRLRLLDMHIVLLAQARLLALTQVAMIESEKLASVGQLAAGMAHEINNPLAFVINNLAVLQRDLGGVQRLLELYAQTNPAGSRNDAVTQEIFELAEQLDCPTSCPTFRT